MALDQTNPLNSKTFNNDNLAVIVSLDLSKAFDTLNYHQLLNKLQKIGFSANSHWLVFSNLRGRTVQTITKRKKNLSGVPQG